MSDITLSSASRANILALQATQVLLSRTQDRLATGLKVNSALDDAISFFAAQDLQDRASDLSSIKGAISSGISVVQSATQGLTAIEGILKQMKALAQSAISAPESSTRASLASQFNELRSQVDNLAEDSSFNGINLLKSSTAAFQAGSDQLIVTLNERTEKGAVNELVVSGLKSVDFKTMLATSAIATGVAGTSTVWGQTGVAGVTAINSAITAINKALTTVRDAAQEFGTNAAVLGVRADFTTNLINTLNSGASSLVNADLNEESADLLSLQTSQQLGIIALSIAAKSEQAILSLF